MWSMLSIIKSTLMPMLHPYVHYSSASHLPQDHHIVSVCPDIIFQILLPCSRPMTLYYVTCHVTAMSCATFLSKRKLKKKK